MTAAPPFSDRIVPHLFADLDDGGAALPVRLVMEADVAAQLKELGDLLGWLADLFQATPGVFPLPPLLIEGIGDKRSDVLRVEYDAEVARAAGEFCAYYRLTDRASGCLAALRALKAQLLHGSSPVDGGVTPTIVPTASHPSEGEPA